jgi:hypothetical protein
MRAILSFLLVLAAARLLAASPGETVPTQTEHRSLETLQREFRTLFPVGMPLADVQRTLRVMGLKKETSTLIGDPTRFGNASISVNLAHGSLSGLKSYENPRVAIEFDENGKVKSVKASVNTLH